MSRRPASFTQADAARALAAALQAAPDRDWRLRILPGGEIVVEPAAPVERAPAPQLDGPLARGLAMAP